MARKTQKKEQTKQYIFMAYDTEDWTWRSTDCHDEKSEALRDYNENYGENYSNEFFLEVLLPEPSKTCSRVENIPTFTI